MIIMDSLTFALSAVQGHVSWVQNVGPLLAAFQILAQKHGVTCLITTHANEVEWKRKDKKVRTCLPTSSHIKQIVSILQPVSQLDLPSNQIMTVRGHQSIEAAAPHILSMFAPEAWRGDACRLLQVHKSNMPDVDSSLPPK